MPLPHIFGLQTTPQMSELDDNFNALGALVTIPCSIAGTNALTLTPAVTYAPTVALYANFQAYSGFAAAANTTGVTAQVGALAALNVYKDTPSGPQLLAGGEIQAGNLVILFYDFTLNSGAGGFHLQNGDTNLIGQSITVGALKVGTGAFLIRNLHRTASLSFSLTNANATNDVTATLTDVQINDFIGIAPPATVIAGVSYMGFCSAVGTVTIRAINATAATLTPTGGTFGISAMGYS